jgi:hypothetical protein
VPPPPANAQVRVIEDSAVRLVVRNGDGTWWIAKRCLGPGYWQATNKTTGPGYVYKLVSPSGHLVVDDEAERMTDAYGRDTSGGLGSFAYQHARGNPSFSFDGDVGSNTWPVTSRICAGESPDPQEPFFGVSASSVDAPSWGADGTLYWAIDVDLATPWRDPFLRVRYEYGFRSSVVKVWTRVHSFCTGVGNCGDPGGQHFVKEPKFTAEVVPLGRLGKVDVYSETGLQLFHWPGADPRSGTGHSGHADRARITFPCSLRPCVVPDLHVVARAHRDSAPRDQPSLRWEGEGSGLDRWAQLAATLAPAPNTVDGTAPPGSPVCRDLAPASQGRRTWELVGSEFPQAYPWAAFFLGWEGGVGPNDCEPLSRRTPASGYRFANHFQYSLGEGWGLD